MAGALALAATLPAGSRVLAMVPDTGERYLSTPLFADIAEAMDAEEHALSRSTPLARFDAPPVAAPSAAPAAPAAAAPGRDTGGAEADAAAVDAAIGDPARPVTMFGLQWCEFCWSLRRFFSAVGVPLHALDLDAPEMQQGDRGGRIRAVLAARVGAVTLPQVFVGGRWIGGCTDTLRAWEQGRQQELLAGLGVGFDARAVPDTRALLPGWVHPR